MNQLTPKSPQALPPTPVYLVRESAGAPNADPNANATERNDVQYYWAALKRHRKLLLTIGLSAALATGLVTLTLPSMYRSTVSVLIEPGKSKVLSIDDVRQGGENREHFQAQVELAQSRSVAENTVRSLKLWNEPWLDPRRSAETLLGRIQGMLPGAKTPEWTDSRLIEHATDYLVEHMKVEALRASQSIRISVDTPNAQTSADIANALASEYVMFDRVGRQIQAQAANSMLQERLKDLRDKLAKSEADLQAYREKKGLVTLSGSAQTLAKQEITAAADRLATARARRAELEGTYKQIKRMSPADYRGLSAAQKDPTVIEALERLNSLKSKQAQAAEKFGTEHFTSRELAAQVADARATLAQVRQTVVDGLISDYEAARTTERELSAQLGSAQASARDLNREEFQLTVLEREVEANRQLYEMFRTREKETNVSAEVQVAVARVIDRALPSKYPVGPKRTQLAILAFVLASSLGAFVILLRMALDKTVKGSEDAEQRLRLPVLSALPVIKPTEGAGNGRMMIDQPRSYYAEAIRTARTAVMLSHLDVPCKTILVTSTLPGEGKTTVATNLALSLSLARRTLVIDADLRRPQLGTQLGLPPNAKGLTNLVSGEAPASQCVHALQGTRLSIIPSGDLPANPLEILLSHRFHDTLKALASQFECIIIDSPPLEAVSDAVVIAPHVTTTILVSKASTTPYPLIRKAVGKLRRVDSSILGLVLNQVDDVTLQEQSHPYATYEYGYAPLGQAQGAAKLS